METVMKWNGQVVFLPSTGYDNSSNYTSDPLFVSASDFQLQTGSPAIGKGVDVGLSTDYKGNAWNSVPSIGAYEYNSTIPASALPVYQNSEIAKCDSLSVRNDL